MGVRYPAVGLSLVLLASAGGTAACSRFNREWRAVPPVVGLAPGVAGRWTGIWQSAANGHEGQLRAILIPKDEGGLDAQFRARFWGIMAYSYRLDLDLEEIAPGRWSIAGEADLGWLAGGRFRCEGTATTNDLCATYASKHDHGRFVLSRPASED